MRKQRRGERFPAGIHLLVLIAVMVPSASTIAAFGHYSVGTRSPVPALMRSGFQPFSGPIGSVELGVPIPTEASSQVRPSSSVRVLEVGPGKVDLVAGGHRIRSAPLPSGAVDLAQVTAAVADPAWIERGAGRKYVLRAALVVEPRASVTIAGPAVARLQLADLPNVFIGAVTSRLDVRDTVVSGVSSTDDGTRPRPFLLADRAATMNIVRTRVEDLGWDSAGAFGLTYKAGSTGSVVDSEVQRGFMGLYVESSPGLVVRNTAVLDSSLAGIQFGAASSAGTVDSARVSGSHHFGIIVSDGARAITVRSSEVSGSGQDGLLVVSGSRDVVVADSRVTRNRGSGVGVQRSGPVRVTDNLVLGNGVGLQVSGTGSQVVSRDNRVQGNGQAARGLVPRDDVVRGNGGQWDPGRVAHMAEVASGALVLVELLLVLRFRQTRRRNRARAVVAGTARVPGPATGSRSS